MTAATAPLTERQVPRRRRSLVQHSFVRGATAVPLGAIGGALLGWFGEAPTDAVRLEQTVLTALLIGFVVAPAMAAALASARYQRPRGTRISVLLKSLGIPALSGLVWALLGATLALLVAPLTDLTLPLPNFPVIAAGVGLAVGVVTGLLTLLVRLIRGSGAEPVDTSIDSNPTAPGQS